MWTRFEGTVETHSPKAVLFWCWYWESPMWFPISQVKLTPDGEMSYVIDVREWLTDKNGILEFTPYTAQQIEAIVGAR